MDKMPNNSEIMAFVHFASKKKDKKIAFFFEKVWWVK